MTSEQSHFSYRKLAAHTLSNNRQTYLPYTVAATVTVMIYYILQSLSLDPAMDSILGGRIVSEFMAMGSVVIAVFSIIFLFYINNFLRNAAKKNWDFIIFSAWKNGISAVLQQLNYSL